MIAGQLALDGARSGRDVVERYGPRAAAVAPIVTSGRLEYAAVCPGCRQQHRHTTPGIKTAPCGALYTIPTDQDDQEVTTDA